MQLDYIIADDYCFAYIRDLTISVLMRLSENVHIAFSI